MASFHLPSCILRPARGQSIVELVLILPLLLMMILGVVDFSLAFTAHTRLRNAVAEGGYWAAQNPQLDETGIKAQIRGALQGFDPPLTDADITVTPCVEVDHEYQTVISVRYNFPVIFGVFGAGSHIPLTNSTTLPQFGGCK